MWLSCKGSPGLRIGAFLLSTEPFRQMSLDTNFLPGTKVVNTGDNPWKSAASATLKDSRGNAVEIQKSDSQDIAKLIATSEKAPSKTIMKEFAQATHEDNVRMGKQYLLPGQEHLSDEKERVRNPMHIKRFCMKLDRILGKTLDGQSRVFLNQPPPTPNGQFRNQMGLFVRVRGMEQFAYHDDLPKGWKKIGSVQVPYMSEFGILKVNAHGLQTGWKYIGWRGQVLLALITQGVITEKEAHQEFGQPDGGPGTLLYRKKLHEHRNRAKT